MQVNLKIKNQSLPVFTLKGETPYTIQQNQLLH